MFGPLQYQNFDAYELSAVDPQYYRKRFIVRLKRHIAKANLQAPEQSVASIVDAIAPNLQLNEGQLRMLTERLEVAGSGDLLLALMATDDDIQGLRRRRSGQDGRKSYKVGGGAHRPSFVLEPGPEPEPEPELGPSASRPVSPAGVLGGSE